jgi:hypothetical protein
VGITIPRLRWDVVTPAGRACRLSYHSRGPAGARASRGHLQPQWRILPKAQSETPRPAARHRLPAIYELRAVTAEGGLMSYGVDLPDLFRQAAAYADRILKGDKPSDLLVKLPTKSRR